MLCTMKLMRDFCDAGFHQGTRQRVDRGRASCHQQRLLCATDKGACSQPEQGWFYIQSIEA